MAKSTIRLLEDRVKQIVERLRALRLERDTLKTELETARAELEQRVAPEEMTAVAAARAEQADQIRGVLREAIDELRRD